MLITVVIVVVMLISIVVLWVLCCVYFHVQVLITRHGKLDGFKVPRPQREATIQIRSSEEGEESYWTQYTIVLYCTAQM